MNVGCIPSKALLDSSHNFQLANSGFEPHGINLKSITIDVRRMLEGTAGQGRPRQGKSAQGSTLTPGDHARVHARVEKALVGPGAQSRVIAQASRRLTPPTAELLGRSCQRDAPGLLTSYGSPQQRQVTGRVSPRSPVERHQSFRYCRARRGKSSGSTSGSNNTSEALGAPGGDLRTVGTISAACG